MPTKVHLDKAMVFSSSHVWIWVLDYKESWEPKNWCFWTVVLKTLESSLDCKEMQPVHPKGNQSWFQYSLEYSIEYWIEYSREYWIFQYSLEELMLKLKLQYLATWCEVLSHLKRPWCWERLKAGGEGIGRGWDDWMASLTQWTWVWLNPRSWWWTGRLGVLQSMG